MVVRLLEVDEFVIGSDIFQETVHSLRAFCQRGLEGLVLWLGKVEGQRALVGQAITPPQESIASEDGVGYFVTGETLFLLNRALSETGLHLLAQVHSHPTDAYHSDTDDQFAIVTADGGLSLVVPDFADGPADPAGWAVFRLISGRWIEQSIQKCRQMLKLV